MIQRTLAVIKKELLEIKRDKGFLLLLILQPIIIMSIFAFTFQGEIENLPTAVINYDDSKFANDVISAVENSRYFSIKHLGSTYEDLQTTMQMLNKSKVRVVIVIPQGFGAKLYNSETVELTTHIDSSDYLIYNTLRAASSEILKEASKDITGEIVQKIELQKEEQKVKIESAKSQVQGLSTAIDQAKSKVSQKQAQVSDITSEVDVILKEFDAIHGLIKDTENDLNDEEEIIENTAAKLGNLDNNVADLIATLAALSETNPELAPIVDELEDMQYELDDLKDDLDNLNIDSDVSEARSKTKSAKERAKTIKEKINALDISEQSIIGDIDTKFYSTKSTIDSVTFDLTGLNSAFLSSPTTIEQDLLFGNTRYLDYLTPAVISMILFFLYIFITTINIVQERTRGTLLRTATTPLKKSELFGGKFLAFAGIGIIESVYVLFIATSVFGAVNHGSLLAAFLIELLLIMPSLGIGLMISTIIKTERQALAILPLVTIPTILISQTFAPIEVMPAFIRPLSYISPMTYSNTALREIMIKGTSLASLWPEIVALLIYGLVALAAGIILYKKKME